MTRKYACREKECAEMTSQSFPVSCFNLRSFVVSRTWNFTFSIAQNTGKKNRYRIFSFFLALLISSLSRLYQANQKHLFHIHFKLQKQSPYSLTATWALRKNSIYVTQYKCKDACHLYVYIIDNLFAFLVFHLSVEERGLGCEGENRGIKTCSCHRACHVRRLGMSQSVKALWAGAVRCNTIDLYKTVKEMNIRKQQTFPVRARRTPVKTLWELFISIWEDSQ